MKEELYTKSQIKKLLRLAIRHIPKYKATVYVGEEIKCIDMETIGSTDLLKMCDRMLNNNVK